MKKEVDSFFMGKRIVVTGSSGFIGTNLVQELKKRGSDVVELDIKNGTNISDWEQVKHISKVDLIFHLAAKLFVPDSIEDPRSFYDSNIASTINILELGRINKAKLIYTSSYLYGIPKYFPIDEKHPVCALNSYSSSKLICEHLCKDYHEFYGSKIIILRPFNIYGLGQNKKFLIPTILNQIPTKKIRLEDPYPKRDYLYISDIITAELKAAEYEKGKFDIFNIGSGNSISVEEIAGKIKQFFGDNIDIEFTRETRKNEIMDTVADITKAKKLLNWEPNISFDVGIELMLTELKACS